MSKYLINTTWVKRDGSSALIIAGPVAEGSVRIIGLRKKRNPTLMYPWEPLGYQDTVSLAVLEEYYVSESAFLKYVDQTLQDSPCPHES